jgi:hypothetical protein
VSIDNVETLVRRAAELTGSSPPDLLDADAPTLADSSAGEMYLIGLIGGKEVGKSALVNALVGRQITEQTSHGPGTQDVIAYAHQSCRDELGRLLESAVPQRWRIITHDDAALGGQVLLDLPDIDSRFADHIEITRKMLRHILYPVWIQSVEKYADAQPQQLLARVAAGNDPSNFLFCLNKMDQLAQPEDAEELRHDFARRIARVLGLPNSPVEGRPSTLATRNSQLTAPNSQLHVFLISAIHTELGDLPALKSLLSRQKSPATLGESRQLASRRRQRSLVQWLDAQDLPGRARRLARLDDEASELLSQRIGIPLTETAIPAILDDPSYRAVMGDGVFARRVARWPIVNLLDSLLIPFKYVIRQNAPIPFVGTQELADGHLAAVGSVSNLVQSSFAHLHQSDPAVGDLYQDRKLWEAMDAQAAEARLRMDLGQTLARQRQMVDGRLSGRRGIIAPFIRILLTVGALLWFPLVQPVLQLMLTPTFSWTGFRSMAVLVVQVLSGDTLLKDAEFLLVWYALIWSLLRWHSHGRVEKLLDRWKSSEHPDESLNLTTCALGWMDDLLQPIHDARAEMENLAQATQELGSQLAEPSRNAA